MHGDSIERDFSQLADQAMADEVGDAFLIRTLRGVINRGGESISPFEIKNLMMSHLDVEILRHDIRKGMGLD